MDVNRLAVKTWAHMDVPIYRGTFVNAGRHVLETTRLNPTPTRRSLLLLLL